MSDKPSSSEDNLDALLLEILHSRGNGAKQAVPPPSGPPEDILPVSPAASAPARREAAAPAEETEEPEDVKVYTPPRKAAAEPVPAPVTPIRPAAAPREVPSSLLPREEDKTQRILLPQKEPPAPESPEDGELEGQLSWEDVAPEEPVPAPSPEDEEEAAWQEQLRQAREEKIRSFRLERGLKLSGEEELNEPEEEPDEEEPEYIEDFTAYEDADAVRSELHYRQNRGRIALFVTLIWELLLIGAEVLSAVGLLTNPYVHIVDAAIVLLVMILINHSLFRDGFEDLREGIAGSETAVCLVSLLTLLHTLLQFFSPETAGGRLIPSLAGFGLLIACWNRQLNLRRIVANFEFVAAPGPKWAAHRVEDPADAVEIGRAAVAIGQPEVSYFRRTAFLKHYLGCAYERCEEAEWMRWMLPSVGIASLLCAVIYAILYHSIGEAFTLFVMLCAIGAPCMAGAALGAPLLRASRQAQKRGALLIGRSAVQQFGETQAVAVDAADLFPEHTVTLSGLKAFSGTRIDEAILDAASVSVAAGGPLSAVFLRMIQGKTELLGEVDTLVYEQEMGLSGWVGGRRVLVGNRKLLENHGVDVPSHDYEMKYRQNGGQLVYLSTAGKLSAMFIVAYAADPAIAEAVRALHREDISLLVRTCDPNITQELICDTLGLNEYYVEILGTSARRLYEQMSEGEDPEAEAGLASDDSLIGKVSGLVYCRRLLRGGRLALGCALAAALLGFVLCALLALSAGRLTSVLVPLAYLTVTTLLILAVPFLRRV